MIDDEEKKKREEEFDNYFSHSTTSTEKEQRANYFDSYFSGNNKFTESNGFETDPTTIKQELNDIMNKKPEIKLSQPVENDNDVEELDTTTRVQNRFLDNSSLFKDEGTTVKEESKPDERVNVIMNNRKLSSLMTDEDKQEIENQKEFASRSNSDKNLFSQFGKMIQNFLLGVTSGGKQFLKETTKTSYNQQQENELLANPNSKIPVIVQEEYKNQQNENSLLNQQTKKKIDNSNMFKIRFNNDNGTIQNKANVNKSAKNINRDLLEYTDSFGDIELNPLTRSLDRSIREDEAKIASNSNEISNPIIKKVSELAPSAGNSLAGATISMINPYLGTTYFIVSAMGSYEDDAKNRGMSKREAEAYGKIMGFMEGATEMIGVSNLLSASKSIIKGSFKEAFKNFGLNVIDNAIQEAVIDPVDEMISAGISGKANRDYTSVEGVRELIGEMIKDGFDGALSAIITGGVSLGISSSVRLYNKVSNNENITERELQQVYNDIQKDGRLNINDIIKDSFNYQKNKMLNDNQGVYMALTFDDDGTITEVREAYGEKFDLTNNNLNVEPAVVDIDGYYNIIDTTSGLKLDTTEYNSKTEAIEQFNNKISNLDNSAINSINRQVEKSKLSIMNEMQRMNEVQAQQNADYYFNNRETPSDNAQDSQETILNDNVTNYTSNTENNVKSENNVFDEISKLTRQIQDKTRYHAGNIEDIANYVSKRLDNVKVEQTPSGNSIVYSTDNQGNITYSQELSYARAYRGSEVKDIINNLVSNADIPVITSTSNNKNNTSKKANKSTFYDDTEKYIITNINNATNEFDDNTTYTKKKVNEIVSNIYDNDYLTEYDNDGNIKNYVSIEDEGNNLVAELYDNEDNLVRSEVIPKENGKYTGKNITDTIRKLTRIESQNRPIKGQLDVEGNEVRSMKKKESHKTNNKQYKNVTELLKTEVKIAESNFNSDIKIGKITELDNINFKKITQNDYIKLSKDIFKRNYTKRIFENASSNIKIKVILDDIKESAYKAYNSKFQNKYLREHIQALSKIDQIIKNADEKSKNIETKNRNQYKDWKYFISQATINNKPFLIEFDVTNKPDGYHFRLQRLVELNLNNNRDTTLALPKRQGVANSR